MTRIVTRTLSTAGALLALTFSTQGQGLQGPPGMPPGPARLGSGVISGQVVDGNGAPVTDALVTLQRPGAPDRVVVDPRGRFVFRNLPAGAFGIVAARPGYLGGAFDQHTATGPGRPVELTDGQSITSLALKLWKGAAIAGTVLGAAGEPVAGVEILALRRTLMGGRWM